jgi:hypothetical protein
MGNSDKRRRQTGPTNSRTALRTLIVLAALAALAVVLVPTSSAKPPTAEIKLYDVCLQGGTTACTIWSSTGGLASTLSGSSPEVTFNVHNESGSNTTLGSLNLDMPSGITLHLPVGAAGDPITGTSTSTQLQLRNLNLAPGGSYAAHFTIAAPSVCGTVQWHVAAKQSNDFNGSGNDYQLKQSSGLTSLITNGCHLAWIYQPASADQSVPITDTAFTPTDQSLPNVHNVAVEVQDASNNPINLNTGTATLSVSGSFDACGTCSPTFTGGSATFQNGRATFPTFQSAYTGTGFTATASALGLSTGASSPPFVIQQNGKDCAGQDPCQLSALIGGGKVDINANGGNFLFLAVSSTQIPTDVTAAGGGCANFTGTGLTFQEADARNGDGTLDITLSIQTKKLKQAYGPNYGQPNVPICAGAKRLDAQHNPIDCHTEASGFADRTLGTDHMFNGGYDTAKCGADGFWWGILGTFQDPNPPFDSSQIPLITGWGSSPDGVNRTFTVHVPAGWDYKGGG